MGGGRRLELRATLLALVQGVTLCRISMQSGVCVHPAGALLCASLGSEAPRMPPATPTPAPLLPRPPPAGSPLDFYRGYSQLLAGCSGIMMRRDSHPQAMHTHNLVRASMRGTSLLSAPSTDSEVAPSTVRELHTAASVAAALAQASASSDSTTHGASSSSESMLASRRGTLSGSLSSLVGADAPAGSSPSGSSPPTLPTLQELPSGLSVLGTSPADNGKGGAA